MDMMGKNQPWPITQFRSKFVLGEY